MVIDYNWLDFAECVFEPSQTIQDAELTIQQYLSMTSSGTPVPTHNFGYQSDELNEDRDLSFGDLDISRTGGIDLYDLSDVTDRDVRRRIDEAAAAEAKRSDAYAAEASKTSSNGTSEASDDTSA